MIRGSEKKKSLVQTTEEAQRGLYFHLSLSHTHKPGSFGSAFIGPDPPVVSDKIQVLVSSLSFVVSDKMSVMSCVADWMHGL